MALDESKNDDDELVEANGVKVVYSKDLEGYVANGTLDYIERMFSKGFRLTGGYGGGSC